MTVKQLYAEGQTDGATVTTSNSNDFGDDALFVVVANSGAAVTYSSSHAAHGTRSIKMAGGTTAGAQSIIGFGGFSALTLSKSIALYATGLPTAANMNLLQSRTASAAAGGVQLTTDGHLIVSNPSGGATLWTSTATLSPTTDYRIDWVEVIDAAAGQVKFQVCTLNSNTPITGLSYAGSSLNTGTTPLTETRAGKLNTTSSIGTFYLDDFRVSDATSAFLGAYSNAAPTVSAGTGGTVPVGTTVTLGSGAATATDSDGTIVSTGWTCTAHPGALPTISNASSLTTATAPLATAGTYTFQLSATDNVGATTTSTVSYTVTSTSPPVENTTVITGIAIIDASGSTAASGGALTYSISPSTGTSQLASGVFMVPRGTSSTTYTVTVVEAGGGTASAAVNVPAAGAYGYTGAPVAVTLPVPLNPATFNVWGADLDTALVTVVNALNSLITFYNTPS